jgi:hypothetical protein
MKQLKAAAELRYERSIKTELMDQHLEVRERHIS